MRTHNLYSRRTSTYPGTIRGVKEWNNTYKIRTAIERNINHIKSNLCLAGRRTQNEKTLHAGLILAGITQPIAVVLCKPSQTSWLPTKSEASHCLVFTNFINLMAY